MFATACGCGSRASAWSSERGAPLVVGGADVEIIRSEPPRRWTQDEKLAAVAATFQPGETVKRVARRFMPVTTLPAPEGAPIEGASANGAIDIAFDGEVRMRITGVVGAALAAALARVLARR